MIHYVINFLVLTNFTYETLHCCFFFSAFESQLHLWWWVRILLFRSWKSLWIYWIRSCVIMKQPYDCVFLNCWQQFPQSSQSPCVRWCVTGVTVLLSAVRSVGSPKPRSAGEGLTRALSAVVEDTHSHTGKTSAQCHAVILTAGGAFALFSYGMYCERWTVISLLSFELFTERNLVSAEYFHAVVFVLFIDCIW